MRIDLVPCPDCGGQSFFGDEACEGCLGRGYVPEERTGCCWCDEPLADDWERRAGMCVDCWIEAHPEDSPHAIEVLPESVGADEYNPAVCVSLGVPVNDLTVEGPWNERIPF